MDGTGQALAKTRAVLKRLPVGVRDSIPDWKHEYGVLYVQPIDKYLFIFRPATLKEVRYTIALSQAHLTPEYITPDRVGGPRGKSIVFGDLNRRMTPSNPCLALAQEYLVKRTVLHPKGYNLPKDEPAYVANSLVRKIWEKSNFLDPALTATQLADARQVVPADVGAQILTYISTVLGMNVEELEDLPTIKLTKLLAIVEHITGQQFPIATGPAMVRPTQEQLEMSRMASQPRQKRRQQPEQAPKRTKLIAVDNDLNPIGPADQFMDSGPIDVARENKELQNFFRD